MKAHIFCKMHYNIILIKFYLHYKQTACLLCIGMSSFDEMQVIFGNTRILLLNAVRNYVVVNQYYVFYYIISPFLITCRIDSMLIINVNVILNVILYQLCYEAIHRVFSYLYWEFQKSKIPWIPISILLCFSVYSLNYIFE